MKKIIALILTVLMLSSAVSPATAAAVTDESRLPVIYIVGKQNTPVYLLDENGDYLLDENGQRVQADNVNTPLGMERGEYIKMQIEPVMKELIPALITGEYSEYIDALVDTVAPIYADSILNGDGVSENTAIDWDYSVQEPSYGAGGLKYYYFKYDWRYSPYETADELHQFVEYVCAKEGVEKVNIHARCYGSNVAMAYIAKSEAGYYEAPFRLNNLALNTTPLAGYIVVGALMSGSVEFDAETVDRFVTYYLSGNDLFEDPMLETIAMVVVSAANQATVLGLGTDAVNEFYSQIGEELIPKAALASYGSFPSYWSMIGDKYFDKAKSAVFGTTEAEGEYAGFIEKINNYHDLIGRVDEETGKPLYELLLKRCEEKHGMKTAILAKYGFATVPMFEGSHITGDGRGTVTELSLGAMGTLVGETFTEKEIAEIQAMDNYDERYISADKKVYAGTCLFPETTWFSKGLAHADLHQIDPIVTEFFLADGNFTVHSDERYPQFHTYENGYFFEVEEEDATNDDWSGNGFIVLIRFISMILKLLTALLNGEIQLPALGGSSAETEII